MKSNYLKKLAFIVALILSIPSFSEAQSRTRSSQLRAKRSQTQGKNISQIEDRNVRAEMDFLAGDALQGRGSGTQFELLAGHYIASQLQLQAKKLIFKPLVSRETPLPKLQS
jgi:hypothetical protein